MARQTTKDTPHMKGLLTEAAKTAPSFRQACLQAGVNYSTGKKWRKEDEEFAKALAMADDERRDHLREEAQRRAVEGWEKPVLYKGEMVYHRDPVTKELLLDDDFNPIPLTEKVISDRILERVLEANVPEYARKSSVELSGPNGGDIPTSVTIKFIKSDGEGNPAGKEDESYLD